MLYESPLPFWIMLFSGTLAMVGRSVFSGFLITVLRLYRCLSPPFKNSEKLLVLLLIRFDFRGFSLPVGRTLARARVILVFLAVFDLCACELFKLLDLTELFMGLLGEDLLLLRFSRSSYSLNYACLERIEFAESSTSDFLLAKLTHLFACLSAIVFSLFNR